MHQLSRHHSVQISRSASSLELRARCCAMAVSQRLLLVPRVWFTGQFHFSSKLEVPCVVFQVERDEFWSLTAISPACPNASSSPFRIYGVPYHAIFHQTPDGHQGVLCKQPYLHITECCVHERVSRTKIATHSFHQSLDMAKLHDLEDKHHWQLDNVFALHLVPGRSSNAMCSQQLCPDSPSPTPKILKCSHLQDLRNRHFRILVFHLSLLSVLIHQRSLPCFMSFDQTPAVLCSRRSTGTLSSTMEMSLKRSVALVGCGCSCAELRALPPLGHTSHAKVQILHHNQIDQPHALHFPAVPRREPPWQSGL